MVGTGRTGLAELESSVPPKMDLRTLRTNHKHQQRQDNEAEQEAHYAEGRSFRRP